MENKWDRKNGLQGEIAYKVIEQTDGVIGVSIRMDAKDKLVMPISALIFAQVRTVILRHVTKRWKWA
jgi:hypothetical protein